MVRVARLGARIHVERQRRHRRIGRSKRARRGQGKLFGHGIGAKTAIVLLTSGLFALAHYPDQGLPGVEQATMTRLVFGTMFAVNGGLWPVMIAHAAFDLAAVAIIYWNIEYDVAHVIFK